MDVRGGDDLARLLPARAHEAAAPAHGFVGRRRLGIADYGCPGFARRQALARLAPRLDQAGAHHRVFNSARAVEIPAIGGAARAPPRFMVGHAGPGARIIRFLSLPGDDATLDVDLPTARTRAVHAVGGAHDLVVLPALAVSLLPPAVFVAQLAMTVGEGASPPRQIGQPIEEVAHRAAYALDCAARITPIGGSRRDTR